MPVGRRTGFRPHISRIRDDAALRQRMVDAGEIRALGYSWRAVAETYLKLMQRIDADGAGTTARHLEHEGEMF